MTTEEEDLLKQKYKQHQRLLAKLKEDKKKQKEQEAAAAQSKAEQVAANAAARLDAVKKSLQAAAQASTANKAVEKKETGFKRSSSKFQEQSVELSPKRRKLSLTEDEFIQGDPHKRPLSTNTTPIDEGGSRAPFSFRQPQQPRFEASDVVYVGNISDTISNDDLTEAFEEFGRIIKMSLQRQKRRAFITFDSVEAAQEAISKLDNTLLHDSRIRVSSARPDFRNTSDFRR
eukprot:Colp12_sorted_trinity150504_noHs@28516